MLRFLLPSIVWTLVVIFVSVVPGSSLNVDITIAGLDKIVHFGMYTLVTLFWSVGLKKQNINVKLSRNAFKISVLGGFGLGLLLEIVQQFFVPFRYFELLDLIANGIGCIFGVILFKIIYREYKRD